MEWLTLCLNVLGAIAPLGLTALVAHFGRSGRRSQALAELFGDAAKLAVAATIEAAGTADLSRVDSRAHALATATDIARRAGGKLVAKLSDDQVQAKLLGELAAIAPAIVAPGADPLPGAAPPAPAPTWDDVLAAIRAEVGKALVAPTAPTNPA